MNKINKDEYYDFIVNFDPQGETSFGAAFCDHFDIQDDKLAVATDEAANNLVSQYIEL